MIVSPRLARFARIALVVAAIGAFTLAILPTAPGPENMNDKVNHAFAFFVLSGLAYAGWPRAGAVRIFVLLTAFGGLIEIVQGLDLIGRDADIYDLFADMVGIVIGLVTARLVLRFAPELTEELREKLSD
jgi:VanZ family protein